MTAQPGISPLAGSSTIKRLGYGHGGARDVDRGLREQAAVDRRAGAERDRALAQHDALGLRAGEQVRVACDLPEDVLRLRTAAQDHLRVCAHLEVAGDLKDPHVVRPARDLDVGRNGYARSKLVEAGLERQAA